LLGLIGISGFSLFYHAPADYLQWLPEELAVIFHPYLIALVAMAAFILFLGSSFGALLSCLNMKAAQKNYFWRTIKC